MRPESAPADPGPTHTSLTLCVCPGGERVEKRAEPEPVRRQYVLDERRPGIVHLAAEDTGPLELDEALGERPRRDLTQYLPELREARAPLVGCVQDRDRVAALEDVRRSADLLGDRVVGLTPPHSTAPASPRARGRAPLRWTSPGG